MFLFRVGLIFRFLLLVLITDYSFSFSSSHFLSEMSTELSIIKNYAMSFANVRIPPSTGRVLVLKTNHELFYLDLCDCVLCLEQATRIGPKDNVHLAWKYFDSHAVMELFIKEHPASALTSTLQTPPSVAPQLVGSEDIEVVHSVYKKFVADAKVGDYG